MAQLTRYFAGGDKVTVQIATYTQTYAGQQVQWTAIPSGPIHASVVALYDNVNHAWGSSRSHNIYRVMINARTSRLLNLDYASTQFLWYDKVNGSVRTLRPIEDELPYGKVPRLLTVIRCEDITDIEIAPNT